MSKVETGRLLDTRFLDLEGDAEESGFFPDEQAATAELVTFTTAG